MASRAAAWPAVLTAAAAILFTAVLWTSLSTTRDAVTVFGWGLTGLAWAASGAVLVRARPRNALGWCLLAVGSAQAWHLALIAYGIHGLTATAEPWPAALWAGYAGEVVFVLGVLLTPTLVIALYPTGRPPARWWWAPIGGAAVAAADIAAQGLFLVLGDPAAPGQRVVVVPDFLQGIPSRLLPPSASPSQPVWTVDDPLPLWMDALRSGYLSPARGLWVQLFVISLVVIWAGTVVRLIRARAPQRQQLATMVLLVMPFLLTSWLAPTAGRWFTLVTLALVPVAVGVGVLRYRLLGIETVLRPGFLWAVLTALLFGVYLSVPALAGNAIQQAPSAGVFVAALVAVGLTPLRNRLQQAAHRLVYGDQRDPLGALRRLGRPVEAAGDSRLLAAALSSVAAAVRAPGAAVLAPDGRVLAEVGELHPVRVELPLILGGDQIGRLSVAAPRGSTRYPEAGARLLAALAPQVAVIVRAHDLTERLAHERDRVVAATLTERNRLRHDLHDGLGPSLSGIALGLQALDERLAGADPGTRALAGRIGSEVGTAVAEVRRIVDDLRPAALDTGGLADAVRRYAESVAAVLPVDVDAGPLPPLPMPVEDAAYRIVTEALLNVVRHAGAARATVTLRAGDGSLNVSIADDGRGLASGAGPAFAAGPASVAGLASATGPAAGVGLASMRRRAVSLGGALDLRSTPAGTTVLATLPLKES